MKQMSNISPPSPNPSHQGWGILIVPLYSSPLPLACPERNQRDGGGLGGGELLRK